MLCFNLSSWFCKSWSWSRTRNFWFESNCASDSLGESMVKCPRSFTECSGSKRMLTLGQFCRLKCTNNGPIVSFGFSCVVFWFSSVSFFYTNRQVVFVKTNNYYAIFFWSYLLCIVLITITWFSAFCRTCIQLFCFNSAHSRITSLVFHLPTRILTLMPFFTGVFGSSC